MSNQNFENNGVNGTRPLGEGPSPGRCFLVQQREPGHHQVTARMKWNKEVNMVVMECFYRSKPFDEERTSDCIMFKKVDKKTLKVQTDRVNEAIKYFKSKNISETSNLIKAANVSVAEQIGLKKLLKIEETIGKNEPRWKHRIEGDVKKLRQDVNLLTRDLKGKLGSKKK